MAKHSTSIKRSESWRKDIVNYIPHIDKIKLPKIGTQQRWGSSVKPCMCRGQTWRSGRHVHGYKRLSACVWMKSPIGTNDRPLTDRMPQVCGQSCGDHHLIECKREKKECRNTRTSVESTNHKHWTSCLTYSSWTSLSHGWVSKQLFDDLLGSGNDSKFENAWSQGWWCEGRWSQGRDNFGGLICGCVVRPMVEG